MQFLKRSYWNKKLCMRCNVCMHESLCKTLYANIECGCIQIPEELYCNVCNSIALHCQWYLDKNEHNKKQHFFIKKKKRLSRSDATQGQRLKRWIVSCEMIEIDCTKLDYWWGQFMTSICWKRPCCSPQGGNLVRTLTR